VDVGAGVNGLNLNDVMSRTGSGATAVTAAHHGQQEAAAGALYSSL
jgi:hypothetical protein